METKEVNQEVSVVLTKELVEKIEESAVRAAEKVKEAQKSFRFHGSSESEKELDLAEQKQKATQFVRAVARGDHETAVGISDERAKTLNFGHKDFIEAGVTTKAISSAGAAGSNYLVPIVFENEIYGTFDSYSEIIRDADVRDFNKPGSSFSLNEIDTRVVVWAADEDATGMTASQPTYSEPRIGLTDWMGSTDITLDFLEDTEVDIMSDLSKQYGEQMAKKIQARFINGDVTVSGVVTKGLINTSGLNEVLIANTTGGYSTVIASDIENAYFSAIAIDSFQEANLDGKWYMHPATLQKLRANVRATTTAQDEISVFDPYKMTLLGRPVVFTNLMPTPATTTSDPFILYGNLRNHLVIRRKRGMTMKLNNMGTSRSGRNLNYQLGQELVVSQRIGHQIVLAEGLTIIST